MKIFLIFVVGLVIGYLLGRKGGAFSRTTSEKQGIGGYVTGQQNEKEGRKEKIMGLFAGQEAIRNDDVEKLLGVSDASATNYLNELEKEGKIEQMGAAGRFVSYRKRPQ